MPKLILESKLKDCSDGNLRFILKALMIMKEYPQ